MHKKKFKVLIDKPEDSNSRACLNYTHGVDKWTLYAYGYGDAANLLAANAAEGGKQDLFIYPIIFLYRHSLELYLKATIKACKQLLNEYHLSKKEEQIFYGSKGHDLIKLWEILKEKAAQIETYPADEFAYISDIVHDFSILDEICKYSERYPEGKKDNTSFRGVRHLSISTISNHFDQAINFLDVWCSGLSDMHCYIS